MDLSFYTIQPRNNKTFILNLIPRIVEGRNARYITGSGQTRPTADRVDLFRVEGNCEKIKRPPRRKKEDNMNSGSGDDSSLKKASIHINIDSISQDKIPVLASPFGALDPTKHFGDAAQFIPAAAASSGNMPFPMIIPYYPPGFSYPGSTQMGFAEVKTEETNKTAATENASETKTESQNNMMFPFPVVFIPQPVISEEDAKKGITPQSAASMWNGAFPFNFPGFPAMAAGAAEAVANGTTPAVAPGLSSMPMLQAMLQQQALSPNGATPFIVYPQMMMPTKAEGTNSESSAGQKRQSSAEENKPKRKKTSKASSSANNSSISMTLPKLERSSSAGEGLELLLAAAGNLEPGSSNDVYVNT